MHQSSLHNMLSFKDAYLGRRTSEPLLILDLGSMDINGSYREHFHAPPWSYLGIDLEPGKNVDIVLENAYKWTPIRSGSADVLISGQAFEHIEFCWVTMLEIARVLKPGGLACLIAPSGGPEHRYPVDCWRIYPDGFVALARFARLEVVEVFTAWEPDDRFTDHSNTWRDTKLVCRKPPLTFLGNLRRGLWRAVMHRMLLTGSLSKPGE